MTNFSTLWLLALSLFSTAAQATVITFNDQIVEAKPNGYTVSGVSFTDTSGSDLFVVDRAGNQALLVNYDDQSILRMDFAALSNSLSLTFGNDLASKTQPGDLAVLELLRNGQSVGEAFVVLNRTDIDQMISLAGINFDAALFAFTDASGFPIPLAELVDDITFTAAGGGPAPIPEPASIAMLGLGLMGVACSRRKPLDGDAARPPGMRLKRGR